MLSTLQRSRKEGKELHAGDKNVPHNQRTLLQQPMEKMPLHTVPYCLRNHHTANKPKIQTSQVMHRGLAQAVPAHSIPPSTSNHTPAHRTAPPRARPARPPPGPLSREAEEDLFFHSGGLGMGFILLLKPLPHVQTSCAGWCNLRAELTEEEVTWQRRTQNKGSVSESQAAAERGFFT